VLDERVPECVISVVHAMFSHLFTPKFMQLLICVAVWPSVDGISRIKEVALRRARLVLRWVTVRRYTVLVCSGQSKGGRGGTPLILDPKNCWRAFPGPTQPLMVQVGGKWPLQPTVGARFFSEFLGPKIYTLTTVGM